MRIKRSQLQKIIQEETQTALQEIRMEEVPAGYGIDPTQGPMRFAWDDPGEAEERATRHALGRAFARGDIPISPAEPAGPSGVKVPAAAMGGIKGAGMGGIKQPIAAGPVVGGVKAPVEPVAVEPEPEPRRGRSRSRDRDETEETEAPVRGTGRINPTGRPLFADIPADSNEWGINIRTGRTDGGPRPWYQPHLTDVTNPLGYVGGAAGRGARALVGSLFEETIDQEVDQLLNEFRTADWLGDVQDASRAGTITPADVGAAQERGRLASPRQMRANRIQQFGYDRPKGGEETASPRRRSRRPEPDAPAAPAEAPPAGGAVGGAIAGAGTGATSAGQAKATRGPARPEPKSPAGTPSPVGRKGPAPARPTTKGAGGRPSAAASQRGGEPEERSGGLRFFESEDALYNMIDEAISRRLYGK